MDDLNTLNIPAFKRKRSISARARKSSSYYKPSIVKPNRSTRKKRQENEILEQNIEMPQHGEPDADILFPHPPRAVGRKREIREMQTCGICEGYFDKIDVAVIKLIKALHTDDTIIFETNDGLFEQPVKSMQIDRKDVKIARSGSDIGIKVAFRPKVGGNVYKVIE